MKFEIGDYVHYDADNRQQIIEKLLELGEGIYDGDDWEYNSEYAYKFDEGGWISGTTNLKNDITEEFMKMLETPKKIDFKKTYILLTPEDQTVERIKEISEKYSKASGYPIEKYLQGGDYDTDWKCIRIESGEVIVSLGVYEEYGTEITEQDLDNCLKENFNNMLIEEPETDTDMENSKTPADECCEGGEVSAGCFHDHCEKGVEKVSCIPPVTEWKCFNQVAEVLGEDNAEYELNKVRLSLSGLEGDFNSEEDLLHAIQWDASPQGYSFWYLVQIGCLPENYHTTPDVLATPEQDKPKTSSEVATEALAESLGVSEDKLMDTFKDKLEIPDDVMGRIKDTFEDMTIGELVESVYLKIAPSDVCITIKGDGTILLHGETVPAVDVSKLEADDIDKAYEALVMLDGLFIEYNKQDEGE
jgi:hypothetical protein